MKSRTNLLTLLILLGLATGIVVGQWLFNAAGTLCIPSWGTGQNICWDNPQFVHIRSMGI